MTQLLLAIIYIAFISLGLPDSLLGCAWPILYPELAVPVSYVGGISMIISLGTVVSSLQSDRLTKKLGSGVVTAISVATTAVALFGFSISHSFWQLCLWAIPYGLGAGSVDASLNNYVALHYASRHMSWLHCMWGVGASMGPAIMGFALTGGQSWSSGYRYVALLQFALTALLLVSLPLWPRQHSRHSGWRTENRRDILGTADAQRAGGKPQVGMPQAEKTEGASRAVGTVDEKSAPLRSTAPLSFQSLLQIPGAVEAMGTFFCYCALEQTAGLWASSYLALHKGLPAQAAASFASLFFIGITIGRMVSGFLTVLLTDAKLVRLGLGIIFSGVGLLLLPLGELGALAGFVLVGLGCAPIYPCIIHATPSYFGADRSQALIGVQMASAYVGNCLMPPLFGLIASRFGVALLPAYLLLVSLMMLALHERLVRKAGA